MWIGCFYFGLIKRLRMRENAQDVVCVCVCVYLTKISVYPIEQMNVKFKNFNLMHTENDWKREQTTQKKQPTTTNHCDSSVTQQYNTTFFLLFLFLYSLRCYWDEWLKMFFFCVWNFYSFFFFSERNIRIIYNTYTCAVLSKTIDFLKMMFSIDDDFDWLKKHTKCDFVKICNRIIPDNFSINWAKCIVGAFWPRSE